MKVTALTGLGARFTEKLDRARARRERARDRSQPVDIPASGKPAVFEVHHLLGLGPELATPCRTCEGFDAVWAETLARLPTSTHYEVGRDLAHALWVLVRHRRSERAVETGVAQGVSSAVVLSAMEANGVGQLWSLDLPPVEWKGQVGAAVSPALEKRWTYLRGSSQRWLPKLIDRIGELDLFLHDALHTHQSMSREFALIWPRLRAGGVLVSDDVDANPAFSEFVRTIDSPWLALAESQGKQTAFGIALR